MGLLRLIVLRCAGQEAECSFGNTPVLGHAISQGGRVNGSPGGARSDSPSVSREHLHWDVFLKSGLRVFSELYIVTSVKRGIAICLMQFKILTNSSPESYSEQ